MNHVCKFSKTSVLFWLMLLVSIYSIDIRAQIVKTFPESSATTFDDRKVFVEEVDMYSNYTYVKITIRPLRYISRLRIWTSPSTYLMSGYKFLKYLGVLSKDGKSYHSLEYDDNYGWSNASPSYKYSYTLVFEGGLDDDAKDISLIDPGISYHGYTFDKISLGSTEELEEPVYGSGTSTYSNDDNSSTTDWHKYVGYTTNNVNMRQCASTYCNVVKVLPKNTYIYIDKDSEEDGFYKVIDLDTEEEGYINKNYVRFGTKIQKNNGNSFVPRVHSGSSYSPPEVNIHNNTSVVLTLRIGSQKYTIQPYGTKTLTMQAQKYSFLATAKDVLPLAGEKTFKRGYDYDWNFKIVTTYGGYRRRR